ncbi:MAG: STAS domain-containing protein [Vicinamibacterales bacterium]
MASASADQVWSVHHHLDHTSEVPTLVIAGRLGVEGAATFRQALAAAAAVHRHLRLDLSLVDYISSAGLTALRDAEAGMQASGGTLSLVAVSDVVQLAFRIHQ